MCRTHVAVYVEYLSLGPRCLFSMFELFRHLSYISILHIFPLHEDYGQGGADDDETDLSVLTKLIDLGGFESTYEATWPILNTLLDDAASSIGPKCLRNEVHTVVGHSRPYDTSKGGCACPIMLAASHHGCVMVDMHVHIGPWTWLGIVVRDILPKPC